MGHRPTLAQRNQTKVLYFTDRVHQKTLLSYLYNHFVKFRESKIGTRTIRPMRMAGPNTRRCLVQRSDWWEAVFLCSIVESFGKGRSVYGVFFRLANSIVSRESEGFLLHGRDRGRFWVLIFYEPCCDDPMIHWKVFDTDSLRVPMVLSHFWMNAECIRWRSASAHFEDEVHTDNGPLRINRCVLVLYIHWCLTCRACSEPCFRDPSCCRPVQWRLNPFRMPPTGVRGCEPACLRHFAVLLCRLRKPRLGFYPRKPVASSRLRLRSAQIFIPLL